MRLRSVALRGLTRFSDAEPVGVDFDAMGPGLVALVGLNGAGKTTLLEAPVAALYRRFPSRPGSLYEHAHGRDAFIEATFDDAGDELKVRLQIDAEGRKAEQYLFLNGQSLTTGRAGEAEAEIALRFGSESLMLASVFCAQTRTGNFLTLPKAERKALFVELLGLGHLELLQAAAKDHRAGAEQDLAAARALLASAETVVEGIPELVATEERLRTEAERHAGDLETARTEETAAVAGLERARAAQEALAGARRAAEQAGENLAAAAAELGRAREVPVRLKRDAEARRDTIQGSGVEDLERRARARHEEAIAGLDRRRTALEGQLADADRVAQAQGAIAGLETAAADLEAATRALVQAEADERVAAGRLKAAEKALEDAEGDLEERRERLNHEAGLLQQVPCTAEKGWKGRAYESVDLAGTCKLLAKARDAGAAAVQLTVAPRFALEVDEAGKAYLAAGSRRSKALVAASPNRLQEIRGRLAELRPLAAKAGALEAARRELDGLTGERIRLDGALEADLRDAEERVARAAEQLAVLEQELVDALFEADEAATAADDRARAASDEAKRAQAVLEKAMRELPSIDAKQRSLEAATVTRKSLEARVREADQLLAACTAKLDGARAQAAAAEGHRLAVRTAETEVGDWTLLEKALGRDGVQALEIDAAGPEVARICNELLEACYGARFSVSFETLREKRSKAGEFAEAFDVKVYDRGHERPVEALSGGERVIVGEALSLSIAILNSRKSGIRYRTLWRDETAGALDAENADAYTEMLRKALGIGGFSQCIFVSHSAQVWERADVRLVVADGRVTVEGARAIEERAHAVA